MKRGHDFLLVHITYSNRPLLSSFEKKTFPLNSISQVELLFSFDLFLNLGFYYINFAPDLIHTSLLLND